MTSRYPVPAGVHRVEETINRSRFLTTVGHAPTVEAARAFIAQVREEFADATHNCWAYVAGPPGSTAQVGMSDDGEPHGTAGRPMLTVLLHSGVGEIVAVVTRYYGGIKLGKGGLVRAYSGGVKLALETVPLVEKVPRRELALTFAYSFLTPVQRLLPSFEADVQSELFTDRVRLLLTVPAEQADALVEAIREVTHGRLDVEHVN
nr:YigZ family protein [Ardenticatena sp.]